MYPNYATENEDEAVLGWLGGLLWLAMSVAIFVPILLGNYHPGVPWRGTYCAFGAALFFAYVPRQRETAFFDFALFIFGVTFILLSEALNHL